MWIVIHKLKVLVREGKQVRHLGIDAHLRQRSRLAGELLSGLVHVVQVQVNVPKRVDKLSRLQPDHLRHHHGQQGVGRDVERHTKEGVGAALVELAVQFALRHMKLKQTVARRQGHLVDETGVPSADHMTPAVRVVLELVQQLDDLVRVRPVGIGPRTPLVAIHRTQIALLVGPFVPNPNPILLQVGDVGVPFQKPQEFVDDGTQVQFFGRQHREPFAQIEPHLVPKTPQGARPSAVFTLHPILEEVVQQIQIRLHPSKILAVQLRPCLS